MKRRISLFPSHLASGRSVVVAIVLSITAQARAQSYAYGYDDTDNLTTATGTAKSWSSASYNDLNQAITLGSDSYTYDANGNLTSDGVRSYSWDAENRLIAIFYPGNLSTNFTYDGLGRRVAVTSNKITTTRYLWSGSQLVQARGANSVIRRYYPEGEVDVPSNSRLAYEMDRTGSVRDVLNVADGSRTYAADYEPYGAVSQSSGAIPTDFRYAGLFTLTDNNQTLYLANYRAYDSGASRWLNRDPIREAGGINLYAYGADNPTNAVDPKGLESWGEWASSWIETADVNFRVFRDDMFNSGFGAGVVLPEGLKLMQSAAGWAGNLFGGCGCTERALPPISGGAPTLRGIFQPQGPDALSANEALAVQQWIESLPAGSQATLVSELHRLQSAIPISGGPLTRACVLDQAAPQGWTAGSTFFESFGKYLTYYAGKGLTPPPGGVPPFPPAGAVP